VIYLSAVLSIRIDKHLKDLMRKVNIDWRKEIEEFIRMRIREELKRRHLEDAKKIRKRIPPIGKSNAELIREDRDVR